METDDSGYAILDPVSEIRSEAECKRSDILRAVRKLGQNEWLPIQSSDPRELARIRLDLGHRFQARRVGNILYVRARAAKSTTKKSPKRKNRG